MRAWAVLSACLGFATGCAHTLVEREVLAQASDTPVRVQGARGPLNARQSKAIIEAIKAKAPESDLFDRHLAIEEAVAGSAISIGNRATLLIDGDKTYQSMFEAIAQAKSHIFLEMYIFETDEIGQRFAAALIAKSRQGVLVSVLYDAVGSISTPREWFKPMLDAGIQVAVFNPVNPLKAKMGWDVNGRDHRKLLVVDGRVAFVGGINISGVNSAGSTPGSSGGGKSSDSDPSRKRGSHGTPAEDRPWRDTQVRIEGPAALEFQRTFLEAWARTENTVPQYKVNPPPAPAGKEAVRVVAGWADDKVNAVYATVLSAISSSDKTVHVTMAYFVPDPQTIAALKEAAGRGVDVKLILPGFSDFWAVWYAGRSHYEDLLAAGVKIYERKDRLLHAKTAVVDGVWSTVGSSNFDWRSFVHNHELNAVILGADFAREMEAMFERDLAVAEPLTVEAWRKRSIADRAKELSARIWAYWL